MQQPTLDHLPKSSSLVENETESTSDAVLEEIIDEVILGLCFEVHRACRLGFFLLDEPKEDEKKYEIVDEIGLDVFGQVPLKKQFDCVCPNCQRNLAASRFAPHLEKCMGMGRNSSRIASKRIANTGKVESDVDDYDNDSDWNYTSDHRKGRPQITGSKKKREKNSPRRTKIKGKNGEGSGTNTASTESLNMFANYETLSIEERKSLLIQMCGVISEHTKKMCTRSHRCPQHSEEQRKSVRSFLLGKANLMETVDDVVDVDTLDESDSQSLRDSVNRLWESSNSTNTSPADSASTASGSSSTKKKEKRPVSNSSRNVITKKNKAKTSQGANSATTNQGVLNLLSADIA